MVLLTQLVYYIKNMINVIFWWIILDLFMLSNFLFSMTEETGICQLSQEAIII